MNAGTSLLGIVITVSGIEWIVVAQQRREKARTIALAGSRDLDHVVWCWVGRQSVLMDCEISMGTADLSRY